jgi:glycosyltransferase involved in cell wall biosynthesis
MSPEVSSIDLFRQRFNLENHPYLVYVGRLDPMKGVKQLCDFFVELKKQFPSPLKLVLAGDPLIDLPQHNDIVVTGFLDEAEKHAAIAGSLALVQSSYFESFSIVLCEAWVQRRPALVQGASTVLRGQATRSSGAIPYEGYAEFEQAVMVLLESPDLANELGENGRKYVEQTYEWSQVLNGFEESLAIAQERFEKRPIPLRGSD